jgi:hypothetical protein
MNEMEFFLLGGVPVKEFKNMELQQNVGEYGKVILEIQSVALLAK